MNTDSTRQSKAWHRLGAWLVLVAGVALSVYFSFLVASNDRAEAEREFAFYCDEAKAKIEARLENHKLALLGGAALFDASDFVSREEWRNYTHRVQIDRHFNGIQGLGFAKLIPGSQLASHVAQVRREGFPDYKVWPAGEREFYTSIIYLEPFKARNLRAFGYDMYSEPVRHSAMEQALDQNTPALSGKVLLVQETDRDVQAGTLMYVPVYRAGAPTESAAQRRAALLGWVYSPFRMNDLLDGVLGDAGNISGNKAHLSAYDGTAANAAGLLFDNFAREGIKTVAPALFHLERQMDFNGRVWTLHFDLIEGEAGIDYSNAYATLAAGILLSVLLFLLLVSLLNTRRHAFRIANDLTAELRKKVEAERALNEQLQLQSTALEASANAIMILDDKGVIEWVNSAFVKLTGYTDADAVGVKPENLCSAPQCAGGCHADLWRGILIEHAWHGELTSCRKDGVVYQEEMTITPVTDGQGIVRHYVAIKQDISERKQAEAQVKTSEERLRFALAATGEGLWDWDIASGRVDHNSRWCQLLGIEDECVVSDFKLFAGHIHEDDREQVVERVNAHLEKGVPYISEHRMRRTDGSIIWVMDRGEVVGRDAGGKPARMVGSFSDVTDRKSVQEALVRSESNLRQILANSPEGVLALSYTNQISFCNERLAKMLSLEGVVDGKIAMDEFLEQLGRKIDLKHTEGLQHALRTGSREGLFNVVDPKRVIRWEVRQLESHELSTIIFFRDVTKDVEIDQMKSEFLATAAHELRTPMSSIYGFVELILTRETKEDERKEYLQIVYDQTRGLINMLNELLDLARIEARAGKDFKFVVKDAAPIIRKVLLEMNIPKKTHPVSVELGAGALPAIRIDEEKIKQVFTNIISNAYKYSPRGGEITVSYEIEEIAHTHWLCFKIGDHGIGMSKDHLNRAFERFFRADNSGFIPGTGLGLSLVKEIMGIHGGTVELRSELGTGTQVVLRFPVPSVLGKEEKNVE